MTDCNSLDSLAMLKQKASALGLTPYASLYGDRRRRTTWKNLLQSAAADELTPLPQRQIETPDRAQINWKLPIALLMGVIALTFLVQSVHSKVFLKITIQVGTK